VTGHCDCYENVGSSVDNKCADCTPGFFNFSASVGCEGKDDPKLSLHLNMSYS